MKQSLENACKVLYFHINPVKNEIFYVGIGNKNRPYSKIRSKEWHEVVDMYNYVIDVVETGLTWAEACIKEKFYIKKIGRADLQLGPLVNHTDGGEGGGKGKYSKKEELYNVKEYLELKEKYNKGELPIQQFIKTATLTERNKLKRKLNNITNKLKHTLELHGI